MARRINPADLGQYVYDLRTRYAKEPLWYVTTYDGVCVGWYAFYSKKEAIQCAREKAAQPNVEVSVQRVAVVATPVEFK